MLQAYEDHILTINRIEELLLLYVRVLVLKLTIP